MYFIYFISKQGTIFKDICYKQGSQFCSVCIDCRPAKTDHLEDRDHARIILLLLLFIMKFFHIFSE